MKIRKTKIEVTDELERAEVEAVRRLATESGYAEPSAPSATYFANMLVKTNQRIDHVTSGKALSISWLARVAVPGVVAILFFFIGLHYYAPTNATNGKSTITDAVKSLPDETLDSLLTESVSTTSVAAAELNDDLFTVSNEQLAEFFIASENPTDVLTTLTETQASEVAAILEARTVNL